MVTSQIIDLVFVYSIFTSTSLTCVVDGFLSLSFNFSSFFLFQEGLLSVLSFHPICWKLFHISHAKKKRQSNVLFFKCLHIMIAVITKQHCGGRDRGKVVRWKYFFFHPQLSLFPVMMIVKRYCSFCYFYFRYILSILWRKQQSEKGRKEVSTSCNPHLTSLTVKVCKTCAHITQMSPA